MRLYDAFYRWCRDATDETHNWPSKQAAALDMTETAVGLGASRADDARPYPSWGEALRVWLRVAMLSFGGPPGRSP